MFYHVEDFNTKRTGFQIRHLLMIATGVLVAALILFSAIFQANAYQDDDTTTAGNQAAVLNSTAIAPISIVEEIDLGEQGVFPADHVLATIHVDGQVYTVDTYGIAYAELNAHYGFELANQDFVVKSYNEHGYDLYVNRMTIETSTEEIEIPYESSRVADDTMESGKEETTTEGVVGTQVDTYETRVLNGETTTRLVSSEITVEPVDEVITYGTMEVEEEEEKAESGSGSPEKASSSGESGSSGGTSTGYSNSGSYLSMTSDTIESVDSDSKTFTTTSGQVYSYSKVLDCTATAYSDPGGVTASGTSCREGAIAVDPSVIPLGSRVYIISSNGSIVYGEAVAEDTGGAIKGNIIDLYYDSESTCLDWGRRSVTVYVLN